jgi:DNA helicase-2/ATP-dependent DNA helicase PcrA
LHETLRRAAEARRGGAEITAPMLSAMHREVWNQTAFPDPRRADTFERNGASQLEAYRIQGGLDAQPEYLEQAFTTSVDGWTLNGVIDRIDRTAEGWRIIDYKSGRPVARGRRDLQVALYALGAAAALKLDPIELQMVYLASGESVRVDHSRPLLAEATRQGTEVAEGVRSGRFDARPDRRRCRLCPYRLVCAEAL